MGVRDGRFLFLKSAFEFYLEALDFFEKFILFRLEYLGGCGSLVLKFYFTAWAGDIDSVNFVFNLLVICSQILYCSML